MKARAHNGRNGVITKSIKKRYRYLSAFDIITKVDSIRQYSLSLNVLPSFGLSQAKILTKVEIYNIERKLGKNMTKKQPTP